jgi:hypothetical protein
VTTGDTDVAVTGNSITTVVEIDFFVEDNDTVTCGDVASTLVDKLEIVIALGFNGKSTVSEGIGVEDNDTVTCGDVASTLVARTLKTGELWSLQNVIHLLRYL